MIYFGGGYQDYHEKETEIYRNHIHYPVSILLCADVDVFVRLSGDLPAIQKSFFRNLVALVFAGIILAKEKVWFSGKKENVKYLLARATAGTLGVLCNFYAVDHMILSDASMLNKMSPFFAIIFSYLILKEKVRLPQALIVAGAFLGSLLIIKPTVGIFSSPAALVGLLGGLGAGIRLHLCARTRTER